MNNSDFGTDILSFRYEISFYSNTKKLAFKSAEIFYIELINVQINFVNKVPTVKIFQN